MAARAINYGSALYGWAIKQRALKGANPFANIPTATTTKRSRVLTDDELKRVWDAAGAADSILGPIVRLLVLTGQRREEVAGMAWTEISPDGSAWTLPAARAKNAATHIVPLSVQARAIVNAQPRRNDTMLVFPGRRGDSPFNGWSNGKRHLDRVSDVKGWTIHDLRRTCATGLQGLGVRLEVTEAVLNHVSGAKGGLAGIYQRHDWAAEKKAALQAWADRVQAIVDERAIDGADNVVAMRA
jgi:integrase